MGAVVLRTLLYCVWASHQEQGFGREGPMGPGEESSGDRQVAKRSPKVGRPWVVLCPSPSGQQLSASRSGKGSEW